MTKPAPVEELGFEQAYEELATLVEQLEGGDLDLENSLELFERGQALAARCNELLEQAELKLRELSGKELEIETDEG